MPCEQVYWKENQNSAEQIFLNNSFLATNTSYHYHLCAKLWPKTCAAPSFHLLLCTDSSDQLKYILFSNLGWTETLKQNYFVRGMRKMWSC